MNLMVDAKKCHFMEINRFEIQWKKQTNKQKKVCVNSVFCVTEDTFSL